jgi:hypothetical protein
MDDFCPINLAKTEFREAFNSSDPERLITLLDPAFAYMPDRLPQTMGAAAANIIRIQFRELTERYYVQLNPIITEIRIQDSVASDYGWHIWKKTPRHGQLADRRKRPLRGYLAKERKRRVEAMDAHEQRRHPDAAANRRLIGAACADRAGVGFCVHGSESTWSKRDDAY